MAQVHEPIADRAVRPSGAWAGWVQFAAVMLMLVGTLDIVQGLVALFDDGYFLARSDDELLLVDFTAWGIVMLVWGVFLIAAGYGLANGRSWARWFGIFAAFTHVIVQIGFLSAYPIWSAIMILLDVLVLFALTARWQEARAAM